MTKLAIPEQVLEQHVAILGKTGSGKSSVMRGLWEWLLDQDKPSGLIDVKGDWWGIKASSDGKRAGYPVVIFGGLHADVPINDRSGAHVAELVATGNRPFLIDLSQFMVGQRTRFFIDFAEKYYITIRGRRWLFIDEVHNFAPQGKVYDVDAGKMLHWANKLGAEGRGKGLQIVVASQKSQKVHKDLLDSCETLIAMRAVNPRSREAVQDWIDGAGDSERGAEVLASLAKMPRGTGWVWSPEIGFGPERVKFPMFKTYDSFKPQDEGHDTKLKGWAEVDLDDVKEKLASVVAEAEAKDPKRLQAEISRLKAELAKKPGAAIADPVKLVEAERQGYERGRVEVLRPLRELLRDAKSKAHVAVGQMNIATGRIDDLEQLVEKVAGTKFEPRPQASKPEDSRRPPPRAQRVPVPAGDGSNLPQGELAIMKAVAQHEGCGRDQLSVLTGYKRSTRNTYIQRLEAKGFVQLRGDEVLPTEEGVAALGSDYEPLPTGQALQDHWIARLPEGERAVLRIVLEQHPNPVAREHISGTTGYKRSTRNTYIQRLVARRLVDTAGEDIKASEVFFQ